MDRVEEGTERELKLGNMKNLKNGDDTSVVKKNEI